MATGTRRATPPGLPAAGRPNTIFAGGYRSRAARIAMKRVSPARPGAPMTDREPAVSEEPGATTGPTVVRRPRLPSPADPDEAGRRPESDPDLWVAVAAELIE